MSLCLLVKMWIAIIIMLKVNMLNMSILKYLYKR